jgi:hypothetical protein
MKILCDVLGAKKTVCNLVLDEIKPLSAGKPGIKELAEMFKEVGFVDVEEDWVALIGCLRLEKSIDSFHLRMESL